MKILYYSHSFGSPTTTFIRNETEYFNTKYSIKYICSELYHSAGQPSYVTLIPFTENVFKRKIRWLLWKYDINCYFQNKNYAKQLNKTINAFQPDIIHCQFGYEALMLLDNISDFEKRKFIIHFHGYDASKMLRKKSYIKKLKEYLSKPNVYTISCNQFFLNKFKNEFGLKISSPFVLNCGIDTNKLFLNANKVSENFNFIQVSSLVEKKGHEYTFKAFQKLLQDEIFRNCKLFITGDGERKLVLEKLVKELGIEKNVIFLGLLKPQEVATYLTNSKVFVHHSVIDKDGDMEGIPTAIMEAMAMNLPVVSTFHSGIPELVENGVNGYLVEEKNIEDYTDKLKAALKMEIVSINREKIMNNYSLDIHNNRLDQIYKQILS